MVAELGHNGRGQVKGDTVGDGDAEVADQGHERRGREGDVVGIGAHRRCENGYTRAIAADDEEERGMILAVRSRQGSRSGEVQSRLEFSDKRGSTAERGRGGRCRGGAAGGRQMG